MGVWKTGKIILYLGDFASQKIIARNCFKSVENNEKLLSVEVHELILGGI